MIDIGPHLVELIQNIGFGILGIFWLFFLYKIIGN